MDNLDNTETATQQRSANQIEMANAIRSLAMNAVQRANSGSSQ